MKGIPTPTIQEDILWRPKDMLGLLDNEPINDTNPRISPPEPCAPFRNFGLYVHVHFHGTADTIEVRIEVEFLDRWTGKWYSYHQGLFAALFYEDTDTANGIWECFSGDVLGRAVRVKVTGIAVNANNYFTVSIGIDLWN